MELCSLCNKNPAVIFVDGKGYCMPCAAKHNIGGSGDILKKFGLTPEALEPMIRSLGNSVDFSEIMKEVSESMRENISDSIDAGDNQEEFREKLIESIDNAMETINSRIEDAQISYPDGVFDEEYPEEDGDFEDADASEDGSNTMYNICAFPIGKLDDEIIEKLSEGDLHSGIDYITNMVFGGAQPGGKDSDSSEKSKDKKKDKRERKQKSALETYATNLNEKAKNGEIDPVIGREREITRVIHILTRRTKNNPCLIGEPGVGKTAIAEGLALKIASGDVPWQLADAELYLLDMSAMLAGTQFRGQFEARMKKLIDEVIKSKNIILVIDEIHTIASAGDAEGAMNAANILKPALSRGDIRVIGATTLEEYRKYIEKDAALERRFQSVLVEEPSIDETVEILKGLRKNYEKFHNVIIPSEILRTAAVLSERYITDKLLPDKAIDVVDEAAAKAKLEDDKLKVIIDLKRELEALQSEIDGLSSGEEQDFERAADLKTQACRLESKLTELSERYTPPCLTAEDIAAVIQNRTNIPVSRISEYESGQLIDLEARLHSRLIGQDEAVDAVARAIRRKRAGISLKRRPVSFIFVGPTGVGKTELVKQIAREVFDSEDALIRLDMSEFMEAHSVSKLIGSPPGYVGYDDAGQLTEKIRRRPYSVILLDEIEKAHPDVFNMLLQILDDGKITDSHGRTVSFENTIIIMTSNAGSSEKSNIAGFGADSMGDELKIDRALKSLFRPEFLNRVDETVIFKRLERDELLQIIDLMLGDLYGGLSEKGISLKVSDEAKKVVLEKSYNPQYGARPMRRFIERHIEDKLAQMLIGGELKAGGSAEVTAEGGELQIKAV